MAPQRRHGGVARSGGGGTVERDKGDLSGPTGVAGREAPRAGPAAGGGARSACPGRSPGRTSQLGEQGPQRTAHIRMLFTKYVCYMDGIADLHHTHAMHTHILFTKYVCYVDTIRVLLQIYTMHIQCTHVQYGVLFFIHPKICGSQQTLNPKPSASPWGEVMVCAHRLSTTLCSTLVILLVFFSLWGV